MRVGVVALAGRAKAQEACIRFDDRSALLIDSSAAVRGHNCHARWVGFAERKKRSVVANAAIARELAGWCWSLATLDD
jgi:hypothetical protein